MAESIKDALLAWGNPSSKYPAGNKALRDLFIKPIFYVSLILLGHIAKKLIAEARNNVAKCIHASSAAEIIFTSGGTEANNWVIHSAIEYFTSNQASGDQKNVSIKPHVVTTNVEHDSVLVPLYHLEKRGVIGKTAYCTTFSFNLL